MASSSIIAPTLTPTTRWLSFHPRLLLVADFLSPSECARLRSLAVPHLSPCLIERGSRSPVRTSQGCFVPRSDLPGAWRRSSAADRQLVTDVEGRIQHLTGIPVQHGEALQILRYGPGERYRPHVDFLNPKENEAARWGGDREEWKNGEQRVATVLVYLNTPGRECGGVTVFPKAKPLAMSKDGLQVKGDSGEFGDWQGDDCMAQDRNVKSKNKKTRSRHSSQDNEDGNDNDNVDENRHLGVRVYPQMGHALFWWNTLLDGSIDHNSLHESEPIITPHQMHRGQHDDRISPTDQDHTSIHCEKWAMTKWIRAKPFLMSARLARSAGF